MCEPTEDWSCKLDGSSEPRRSGVNMSLGETVEAASSPQMSGKAENDFSFPCGPSAVDDEEEVTESKIRAFLDEKVLSY